MQTTIFVLAEQVTAFEHKSIATIQIIHNKKVVSTIKSQNNCVYRQNQRKNQIFFKKVV